jgi:hypothetical protein
MVCYIEPTSSAETVNWPATAPYEVTFHEPRAEPTD